MCLLFFTQKIFSQYILAGGGGHSKYLKNRLRNVSDAYLVLILTFQKLYSAINNTGRSHKHDYSFYTGNSGIVT